MYSVKRLEADTILERTEIKLETEVGTITAMGKKVSCRVYAVIDDNGNIVTETNLLTGKPKYSIFNQKKTAQEMANLKNERNSK